MLCVHDRNNVFFFLTVVLKQTAIIRDEHSKFPQGHSVDSLVSKFATRVACIVQKYTCWFVSYSSDL